MNSKDDFYVEGVNDASDTTTNLDATTSDTTDSNSYDMPGSPENYPVDSADEEITIKVSSSADTDNTNTSDDSYDSDEYTDNTGDNSDEYTSDTSDTSDNSDNSDEYTSDDTNDELSCAICLGLLWKPITLLCQHNFCKGCLLQCSEKKCPTCRLPFVIPAGYNRTMENAIELFQPERFHARRSANAKLKLRENIIEEVTNKLRCDIYRQVLGASLIDLRNREIAAVARLERSDLSQRVGRATESNTVPLNYPSVEEQQELATHSEDIGHFIMMHMDIFGLYAVYANHLNLVQFIAVFSQAIIWLIIGNIITISGMWAIPNTLFMLAIAVNIVVVGIVWLCKTFAIEIFKHLIRHLQGNALPEGTVPGELITIERITEIFTAMLRR